MKKVFLLLLLLSICFPASGQTPLAGKNAQIYRDIPREEIFVHYTTSLLFAGEYLYYKIYTRSETTGLLSNLSKIAYVELLGEDGTRIFKHKIKLNNGTGQGDFFLPTTVPSGNYKLVAYTRWMLNNKHNFFGGDVAVVNPYRGDQSAVSLPNEVRNETGGKPSGISTEEMKPESLGKDRSLQLSFDRSNIGKREQVVLNIRSRADSGGGNYSVSVRKIENFDSPPMLRVADHMDSSQKPSGEKELPKSVYLPELRGELLSGRIRPKNAAANVAVNKRNLILSIPGEDYMIKVAGTNEKGEFFFNLNGSYSGNRAFLEIIGEDKDMFSIEIAPGAGIDHSVLTYKKFYLTPAMEKMILERSIYNQIENAYYGVKPDTLTVMQPRPPFYEELPVIYDLDDFTRFPGMRETFTEIIKEAAVRRNTVMVRMPVNAVDFGMPSLLIVDGMVVQDQKYFLETPATEVKSIAVLPHNYYLGPHMFQGVVEVVTLNKNFWERYAPPQLEQYNLENSQPVKNYFNQSYSRGKNENIPDFRYQLLWQPGLVIEDEEEVQLEFFTGEITGEFEIILQGLTTNGSPVFIRDVFTVE
ncbi:MAG TPA: hypothetical protein VLN72_00015 [Gillisia sp.]|nr:hypothetical protein [Gillisia sp.]